MPYGYCGRILRVDLTREKIWAETQDEVFYRRYFGGRGLIAYYLLKELRPKADALGPENKLVFASGVVTGGPFPGSGRNSVGAKSPLTGAYGDAEVGGFWGAELKHAGYDAAIIDGKAESPVYLWVHDGKAEIFDGKHLWGKDTGESQQLIRKEHGDDTIRTAQIGPAGESLVRYACIINDLRHAAGRCGLGAVMGSKNLKAIAAKGHDRVKIANPDKLRTMVAEFNEKIRKEPLDLSKYGTGSVMVAYAQSGNLPYHNFRDGGFPNPDAIDAKTFKNTYGQPMGTCFACTVRCKKVAKVEGKHTVDPDFGGPEYETLAALGSCCGVNDLAAICKANELCQRYGLDTISTGVCIAFGMECFESSLLTEKDTEGLNLTFGNSEAMVRMVELIGERRGIGKLLGEGVARAAKVIGKNAEKFAIHVKGQEVPMHEPRFKKGLGLGYAMSPTGADHVHNIHDTIFDEKAWNELKPLGVLEPILPEDFGPHKVRLFKIWTDWRHLANSMVICNFPPWDFQQKVDIIRNITGWDTSTLELATVGERVETMCRAFNIREGFTTEDDWLPDRFFHPHNTGTLSETSVSPKELQQAKRLYHEMMGWDTGTGIPTRGTFERLDIGWVGDLIQDQ
ncbi:MAG: aldehyde ferredoxin oxidoreductase family protein [archaeon]